MSVHLPSRRLVQAATRQSSPAFTLALALAHRTRPFSTTYSPQAKKKPQDGDSLRDTLSETELRRRVVSSSLTNIDTRPSGSIFAEELAATSKSAADPLAAQVDQAADADDAGGPRGEFGRSTRYEHMQRSTDPDPRSRERWQRKAVIQSVRRAGRESRAERVARTERQQLLRSPWLGTSTKKLVHLARQVAGRRVDDALTQMRFSKKKMAEEVAYQINETHDLAVVGKGMGLGHINGELAAFRRNSGDAKAAGGRKIQLKDGKWLTVTDPTRMYIAQAWVNRGPSRGKSVQFRSRGRTGIWNKPSTSISILLKEEKTRLREYDDRLTKEAKRAPWVHLPNRPVTAQRQYYSW